ncbi:FAD-dependent thymidylate synthase [Paludifilum halophilum]|uniref:FAD-dependent thymidylate synthase n=1 Tax=Paludifilum halophilum TaxID=1642702 RepID=A0A235B8K3_9BACL|nr:FAD-dependent thymidylate synthase [Paludifilum halophilum]OYD08562.1 thymidylate synthase (FAD) [Paludifilum halophilum]
MEIIEIKGKPTVKVLDKGYVRMVDTMGDDLTVVNAARVSYDKQKEELDERDERLIRFLAREGHTSPFRHASLQFEIYAPLMVARQWWKYVVGSSHQDNMVAWNESSRRYVTEEPTFYILAPDEWRQAPENSKQGSGDPVDTVDGIEISGKLIRFINEGERLYREALEVGICAEQARLFLPAYGMYVRWYWTSSLQGVAHFLNQRLAHDAQKEIQGYAQAVDVLARKDFPRSLEELVK